ncbi:hypothetical protein [Sciscionella sediminilitoris]|uniref:hypothetical protein n=1 Tax=Sciscionella sediminilitoris TaxID=1445613 RepID=UPI0004DFA909|nr:hypothetical protein [Sciscionella sp. SE31]
MAEHVYLERIESERVRVPIVGTSSLIMHRFSEKAKNTMLDSMQGRKPPKEHRNPEAEYEAAMYRLGDGQGFPVVAFKAATIGAARFYSNVKMTELRQCLFFSGQLGEDNEPLAPIEGEPKMRQDVVRFGINSTDLRYRPEFLDWATTLDITYVKSFLSRNSLLSLIDAGGLGCGVGEWRPEKKGGGQHGTYRIDPNTDIEVIE